MEIFINKVFLGALHSENQYNEILEYITDKTGLQDDDFFLEQNGKILSEINEPTHGAAVHCVLRCRGGKGGFGSMLRAIGAQIEKTTNREACRDLSGRRLRDINEEKRLKAWLEKQGEREREAEERKKRKIQKLLSTPKHDFKDEQYEEAREKLTEKVNDAVEEGFKKFQEAKASKGDDEPSTSSSHSGLKRKSTMEKPAKKKRTALWIDDISETDSSSSESDSEAEIKKDSAEKSNTKSTADEDNKDGSDTSSSGPDTKQKLGATK